MIMQLSQLLQEIVSLPAQADVAVNRLVLDSRQVGSGDVFVAIKGTQQDGRQYIPKAISQGAIAVLAEADASSEPITWQQHVPIIPIPHLHTRVAELAVRFYQAPAKQLRMIGVTGTSGKTSCTHFIAQLLQARHIPCGLIGTLGCGFYGALGDAGLTTPDAITLQAVLRQFVEQGAKAIAMEVSSHSIDQGRINHIAFDIGVFTNLSQDHLDYHGDMASYAAVKRRFLTDSSVKHAIINADDPYGKQWLSELAPHQSVYAYQLAAPTEKTAYPVIYTTNIQSTANGTQAQVVTPWGEGILRVPLVGTFNLSNALAVLTVLAVYGIPFNDCLAGIASLHAVPGRMQQLGGQGAPLVVVDYAHKPDALEKVLKALRSHTTGKLVCVFGCGGERDRSKRPLMAAIAEQWADQVIVTNDNPRHESPEAIANEILGGFKHPDKVTVELDRSKAIQKSIQWTRAGDCVLIAGKGAERYQQVGDTKHPFDDVAVVSAFINEAQPAQG